MNARIYFARNPTFGLGGHPAFPDEYDLVASVECDSAEATFPLCNTIDAPWWENKECELLGEAAKAGGARSMSVGDVAVLPDGHAHRVEMVGWEDLGKIDKLGFGL